MNRAESRYFNTAVQMDEALLTLLEKKEFSYITIRELCEAAGVNRSTFYLHYQNMNELLEESIAYMDRRFYAYFPSPPPTLAQSHFISSAYLEPYLTYIKEHRRLFQTAQRQSVLFRSEERFQAMFQELFSPYMDQLGIPCREQTYLVSFYLHGILAIVEEWLRRGCQEEIPVLTQLIIQCVKP